VPAHGTEAHSQIVGDFEGGEAEAEAGEDFAADGGGVAESAGAGVFALGLEGRRFGDFAAEEQAASEVGDVLVPEAGVDGGEEFDVMALAAGEGGRRRLESIDVVVITRVGIVGVDELAADGGVGEPGIEDGADEKRVINRADFFLAGGAEPTVAEELGWIVGMLRPFCAAAEIGFANHGLLKIIGDHSGEPFPTGTPDGMRAGKAAGVAGIEQISIISRLKQGDGTAVFAAEVGQVAFVKDAARPGVSERGGRDAEHLGHLLGILPGKTHRMAITLNRIRLDGHFMRDRLIRMGWMV